MNGFLLAAATAAAVAMAAPQPVAFPDGYRHWTHVKSATVNPASPAYAHFGGMHHVYGNKAAMQGYAGKSFPDGSVIVFDVLEWKETAQSSDTGARRIRDVMVKDSRRYAATGGWGYTEFQGDSRTERNIAAGDMAKCSGCHTKNGRQDSVFSAYKD
jgi:hypothetical protein